MITSVIKKTLAAGLFAVAMMLLCLPLCTEWAYAAPDPDPVDIGSWEQLDAFITGINDGSIDSAQDARLLRDIEVPAEVGNNWVPLARDIDHAYQGSFEGNFNTISGINIDRSGQYPDPWKKGTEVGSYTAFLSFLGTNGEVWNLTVEASITDVNDVAGIVSQNYGTIKNCTFQGTLHSDVYPNEGSGVSPLYPQGIIGDDEAESGGIAALNAGTIHNCYTAEGSSIYHGGTRCGGIVGTQIEGGTTEDCSNYGAVTLNETKYKVEGTFLGGAGGIVGGQAIYDEENFDPAMKPSINNCGNFGTVECETLIGGICGESYAGDIIQCINTETGTVNGITGTWGGGIVGLMQASPLLTGDNACELGNCRNHADINASGATPAGYRIGGIAGVVQDYLDGDQRTPILVHDCYNAGKVRGDYSVGGVIGHLENGLYPLEGDNEKYQSNVYNLINANSVQGCHNVGGIAGSCPGVMACAVNFGPVRALPYAGSEEDEDVCLGGIAGYCGTTGHITTSLNYGRITAPGIKGVDVLMGGITGGTMSETEGCYSCIDTSGSVKCLNGFDPDNSDGMLSLPEMVGLDNPKTSMPELFDGKTGFRPQVEWETKAGWNYNGVSYVMSPLMQGAYFDLEDILKSGLDFSYHLAKSLGAAVITVSDPVVYDKKGAAWPASLQVTLKGEELVEGIDYEIFNCYNNTKAGEGIVLIQGTGKYYGTVQGTFTILPAKAAVKTLKAGKKKLTVKMAGKPSACGAAKYQIQYRVKGAAKWKTVTCTSASKTIAKLKKGKKYQVQVRAFIKVDGETLFGEWSDISISKKVK